MRAVVCACGVLPPLRWGGLGLCGGVEGLRVHCGCGLCCLGPGCCRCPVVPCLVRVGGRWSGRFVLGRCLRQWLCQRVVSRRGCWGGCPPVLVVVGQWVVLLAVAGRRMAVGSCIDGIVHFSAGIALLCTVPVKAAAVGESGRRLGEPVVVGLVVVAGGLATACVCTGCRARLSAPSLLVRGRIPRSL